MNKTSVLPRMAAGSLALALVCTAIPASASGTVLECIVEPDQTVDLSLPVDGVVSTVTVDKSDRISAGQVLATLESGVEQAQVELARTRAEADDEINSRRIERDLARDKLKRMLELFAKSSVPGLEKDEAEAEAALADLALKQAYSNRKMAKIELQRARAELDQRTLTSPIDGVVVERYVHPGESVKDQPLLKVAKIDPMRVEIIAPSDLFGSIAVGMEADIELEGDGQARRRATVTVVDSLVDAASGTFAVRLSLPNPDNTVVGGLKCRAFF